MQGWNGRIRSILRSRGNGSKWARCGPASACNLGKLSSLFLKFWFTSAGNPTSSRSAGRLQSGDASLPMQAGLMQRVVINDLLTQITAVFVTIGAAGGKQWKRHG